MEKKHNPYDISTWGNACGRGISYADHGPVKDGQKGAIRKLSGSRRKSTPASPTARDATVTDAAR